MKNIFKFNFHGEQKSLSTPDPWNITMKVVSFTLSREWLRLEAPDKQVEPSKQNRR
jgi:hypothetical protein